MAINLKSSKSESFNPNVLEVILLEFAYNLQLVASSAKSESFNPNVTET